jgi:phosphoribosylformimino-5-aminoimidazole carboxamide ribotide isomerase
MQVIPAIDLRDGRCVRVVQGDFARETVFSANPAEVACRWQELGASRLHVVDLDGAAAGEPRNLSTIEAILKVVSVPVQVGGGIRTEEVVKKLLGVGVDRVILGTAALRDPQFLNRACEAFGERVAVGIDARDGKVAVQGWLETSDQDSLAFAGEVAALGARRVIYTDISRDGMLTEPNFAIYEALAAQLPIPVVASGGISSLAHLERLHRAGVEAAIIGMALYKGKIDLTEAIGLVER